MLGDESLGQMISEIAQLHNESGSTQFQSCGRAALWRGLKTIEIRNVKEDFNNPQGPLIPADCAERGNWYNHALPKKETASGSFWLDELLSWCNAGLRETSLAASRPPNRTQCQRGEIGRHDGFKIHCLHGRGGSSPPAGTTYSFS